MESSPRLLRSYSTLLCTLLTTYQMQNQKQSRFDHLRFPALSAVACFHFEFSLANANVKFVLISRLDYFDLINAQF